jgi:hypothetical protein
MSWPNFSVREVGRDKVGLVRTEVLPLPNLAPDEVHLADNSLAGWEEKRISM